MIFHTGWLSLVGKDDKRYIAGEPGLGKQGAEYLASKEAVAVGADSLGLEAIRSSRGRVSSRCTRLSSPRTASTFEPQHGRAGP